MRTPLALLVGSLLVSCTIGDSGPGTGGGDDEGGAACGDGIQQAGEACDDGNTAGGDGCSATCTEEATPRLDMVIDNPAISTELNKTHMLTATLVSSGGFSGPVNLTATVVDEQNNPLPGWVVAVNTPTVNVPADGSVDAIASVTIPSENKGLVGKVKIDATSSLGSTSVESTLTALNQLTFEVTLSAATGTCVYPTAGTVRVTRGSKVRFLNKANDNITIHIGGVNGGSAGLNHQPDPGSAPNTAYEQTVSNTGVSSWYCHAPGPQVNNLLIQGVAP